MRSYYEGSQFDQTTTKAAGPWGTPDHVAGGSATGKVKGNWERTIGLYRTSDSYIVQSRNGSGAAGGVLWYGSHAAPYTAYVPFPAAAHALPDATLGQPAALQKQTLFWAIRYLANYAQLKRNHAIVEIDAFQRRQHASALKLLATAEQAADQSPSSLAKTFAEYATSVVADLWALADGLMFKYADGMISTVSAEGQLHVAIPGYPDWWLKEIDYASTGPPPVPPPTVEWV